MRPRIGKEKWWDKVSPSEAEKIRIAEEKKKRFSVVRASDWYMSHPTGLELRTYLYIVEEQPRLVYRGETVVRNVTAEEAVMWKKMME